MKNVTGNVVPQGCPFPNKCFPDHQYYKRDEKHSGSGNWACDTCKREDFHIQPESARIEGSRLEEDEIRRLHFLGYRIDHGEANEWDKVMLTMEISLG